MSGGGSYRLDAGGRIDRTKTVSFTFDGRTYRGYAGDTLASALLAAGVRVLGRSFKYHRPRGVLSAGIEESNALVTVGSGARAESSVRATVLPLFEGLAATSQNCWPSVHWDAGRIFDVFHGLFAAGFYNKMFKWPSWEYFEPAIRRTAGLGAARTEPDPDRYETCNRSVDVLVVGGGCAGMAAALQAAESGRTVLLLEQDSALGGDALGRSDQQTRQLVDDLVRRVGQCSDIQLQLRTMCAGAYDHGTFTALERIDDAITGDVPILRQRFWRIRAREVVLATGAIEQPMLFEQNDLPGVMLASSVRQYLNRWSVACGRQVLLVTDNDPAYQTVFDLHRAGVRIAGIVDTRRSRGDGARAKARELGLLVMEESYVERALGNHGVRGVVIQGPRGRQSLKCDLIAMSSGLQPTLHLYCQSGGKLRFDDDLQCLVPTSTFEHMRIVGVASGAVGNVGEADARQLAGRISQPSRAWVDFQHDVTVQDVSLAVAENYVSVEHLKRYTTNGMSVDQGKTSNLNALKLLARATDREITAVGTTTYRPPYAPVTLAAIAGGHNGEFYHPKRQLPSHDLQVRLGACFEDFSGWQRPVAYPRAGETLQQAIDRAALAVRSSVGIFEASPLGKILVRGPDAAEFLDRIYANTMSTLKPGAVRYGLMLNERGVVIDDGVCARLAEETFWVSTTGSGASRIANWMEEWLQCEWPTSRVVITPETTQWATVTLAGPRARELLQTLECDIDVSRAAMPHLSARQGTLLGLPCHLFRVSFTGEVSYEINIPADYAEAVWTLLLERGREFDITPFGIESLMTLRIEKGFLHVGADTDGTTIPDDVGFGVAVAKKKADFIGRGSLALAESLRTDRLQFMGLRCVDSSATLHSGANLLERSTPRTGAGYVTSACFSPSLGQHIGLGLLRGGRGRVGEVIEAFDEGKLIRVEVVAPGLFDVKGERMHG